MIYGRRLFLLLLSFTIFFSCLSFSSKPGYQGPIPSGGWLKNLKVEYSVNGEQKYALTQIYFPKTYKKGMELRTLIALHGYKGHLRDWENNSNIETYAESYNFIIVCPNMGMTIYETRYYPETKIKWNGVPGGKWIAEILIPYLQKNFAVARRREMTGILGLSTGGRGAILIASTYNDLFGAAAGLSGDYDPLSMTKDRLLTSVYGEYDKFKERWQKDDNIMRLCSNLKDTPVFIAHGEKDYNIPFDQSQILVVKLLQERKRAGGGFEMEYILKKYNFHDWSFWSIMVSPMMSFFNKHLKADK